MPTPKETTWDAEPHTLAKHEILRRYLGAWFPILGTHNRKIVYIDGFCGPGRYTKGEPGSPIIALEEALKQIQRLGATQLVFLFVDERVDRINHLKNELGKLSIPNNFTVGPETGEFATRLGDLLDQLESKGSRLAPTFAFIDPFGFKGLPFSLVSRLLCNEKTEVFINMMAEPINRFLEHPDLQVRQSIVDLFGTPEALQIAKGTGDRITQLRLLYQTQLSKYARFVRYFEMRDCHRRTIYYLFFAGNHRTGHVKMKEAFWKVDPSSGFCFSDATNPTQPVLFEINQTPVVANGIRENFAKRKVFVAEIQAYIEDKTPFLRKHMLSALKLLESEDKIKVDDYKCDGKKRRQSTYPVDAIVEFK